MTTSLCLSHSQRKQLLEQVRNGTDPQLRLRAHIILLLAQGCTWACITAVLFTFSSTIHRQQKRFLQGGIPALLGRPASPGRFSSVWAALVFRWVSFHTPIDFGFVRGRWSCQTLVVLLKEDHGLQVGRETVRLWLHRQGLVWRRPRPVLARSDPDYEAKVAQLRDLLQHLPKKEAAFFQDEVDIQTNPKIGSMWMRRGQQAEVVTPGNNTKRYLAGSLCWHSGALILSQPGTRRNATLFIEHLEDLRKRFRCYRRLHIICDNAIFHTSARCRQVREYLKQWGHRIVLHFLPRYAPQTNPVERVWWHLHDRITRNHRCESMEALIELVFQWLNLEHHFDIETSIYD